MLTAVIASLQTKKFRAFSEKVWAEFPQGLKPDVVDAAYGTAEQAAEKVGKADSPRAEAREERQK